MRSNRVFSATLLVAGLVSTPAVAYAQGKAIASNDEWFTQTLGSTGADDRQFLKNAIDLFGLIAGNSVLIYSNNGFLANANVNLLTGYVNGGGNVFDIAGTDSMGSAAAEAAANNAFLNAFGLGYAPFFQGLVGNANTSTFAGQGVFGAALFHDVNSVFINNGNDVVSSAPVPGVTSEVFSLGDHGLYGIAHVTATPEPASVALMATGLFGLVPLILRRRQR